MSKPPPSKVMPEKDAARVQSPVKAKPEPAKQYPKVQHPGASLSTKTNPYQTSPLYDLLKVFERARDQWVARYTIIMSVVLLKAAVGLGLFSGKGEKPINGDFEAQRHWMELTTNLPMAEWYFYDLQYWGLDYPPLTAYHLWMLGHIGSLFNTSWFSLWVSRGLESPQLKTYMRMTCIASELIVYVPAVMQLASLLGGKKQGLTRIHQLIVITLILCQPALVLIDNGHFQYNSVMLGLFLLSVIELMKDNLILASIWFMSSVMFKQMALYYSPFIFFFVLSRIIRRTGENGASYSFDILKLLGVGITVALTTAKIFLPFILTARSGTEALETIKQILIRMFPFNRGLFEDKVANFWCTTNIVVKYASRFSNDQLKQFSLGMTLLAIAPPCLMCFYKNHKRQQASELSIIYGFSATAWAFFLFLFQVHEKTVLVPLIPSSLLLLTSDASVIGIIQWINNISTFSMFPLLKRDGLALQYVVTLLMINWFIGGFNWRPSKNLLWPSQASWVFKAIIVLSYVGAAAIHIVDLCLLPPQKYPDLWVLANTTLSFGCFSFFYMWLLYKIYHL